MNNALKIGIAAAAVLVLAVVGVSLLPGTDVNGPGGAPEATATPTAAPTAVASPSPTPAASPSAAAGFPAEGPIAAGRYPEELAGVPLTFNVPAGWTSFGFGNFGTGTYGEADGIAINIWSTAPDNLYSDPCAHIPLSEPPARTAAGLAAAVAAIPGTDLVSGPTTVMIGGREAQHVVFTIREDLGCDPESAYLWYDEQTGGATGGWWWAGRLGETHQVWIMEIDGTVGWINSESFKGSGPEIDQQIQQVIDSIEFE